MKYFFMDVHVLTLSSDMLINVEIFKKLVQVFLVIKANWKERFLLQLSIPLKPYAKGLGKHNFLASR